MKVMKKQKRISDSFFHKARNELDNIFVYLIIKVEILRTWLNLMYQESEVNYSRIRKRSIDRLKCGYTRASKIIAYYSIDYNEWETGSD